MQIGLRTGLMVGVILFIALIIFNNYIMVCSKDCPLFPSKSPDFVILILFLLIPIIIGFLADRYMRSKRTTL